MEMRNHLRSYGTERCVHKLQDIKVLQNVVHGGENTKNPNQPCPARERRERQLMTINSAA